MDTINPQRTFAYQPCAEQRSQPVGGAARAVRPVAVVGAGPVGLAAAIDLAQRGVPVVVLDDDDTLATGSRAICFAKRTLDILDRLGCGDRVAAKGVSWHVGKVFFGDEQVYRFDLLPEAGHRRPAFVNLQQYYLEGFLIERAAELPGIELRWRHRVTGVAPGHDEVALTVSTPDGDYALHARYVVAADGAHSAVRQSLGLESKGRVFRDRFLIADVKMAAPFPAERWFWFDPPFNRHRSALLHRQPDDVWRLDFQLGWDADPDAEKQPERVIPRIRAMLGGEVAFTLEWVSVYTFCCQRMDAFRHGRVLFAGDAAHRVSPFGARGANSGVQDAENLAWKLALVLAGRAGDALLDSYASEREAAADENIRHSTRSTDFITPKSAVSRTFRDAVLRLARRHAFARQLVNSGRLSLPTVLADSPLNMPDHDVFAGAMVPGAPCVDAPLQRQGDARPGWLLGEVGDGFTLLVFGGGSAIPADARRRLATGAVPLRLLCVVPPGQTAAMPDGLRYLTDAEGLAAHRYDGRPGTCYLIRPDQHVCARWRAFDAEAVHAALLRALCLPHDGQMH
ncbi:FAD-dependent oxidoreductase [Cupriavidus sp. TA19]|uniref:FAD-dependent oxidoreductase n=1 Tax=unclassified Cupriavidus TaxID=2640874 RepID=UPI000E2F3010|nr:MULTISPECIES: FAD-dependent oxidoreductase [unclassified Cupriavidus]BDB27736.1 FAD-dependent oxidoreductase [Cupriavidus sp. P-10]GLC97222.1 FAD-dependent oxidoreductase [Cupriavidus sp. TA19]